MSVVDTAANRVVDTIGGFDQPWNLSITADGSKLYVDTASHTGMLPLRGRVFVVDTCRRRIVKEIPMPGAILSALSADGRHLYSAGLLGSGIRVTDTATDRVVRIFPRQDLIAAQARLSVDDGLIYASGPNYVVRLDARTGEQVGPALATGLAPAWTSFTPDGSQWVTHNTGDGTITIIDVARWAVVATLDLGPTAAPAWGSGSPDGTTFWNGNGDGTVSIVDMRTHRLLHTIDAGVFAIGVTFDPSGRRVFVASQPERDTATMPNGQLAFVTTIYDLVRPGPGQISVYDARTYELLHRFPTGSVPTPITLPHGPFPPATVRARPHRLGRATAIKKVEAHVRRLHRARRATARCHRVAVDKFACRVRYVSRGGAHRTVTVRIRRATGQRYELRES